MPNFTVTEGPDPLLSVDIRQGESINAVACSMATMDLAITLKGRLKNGPIRSLFRRKAQGDSVFLEEFVAKDYPGNILLSPTLPGSIEVIRLGPREELHMNDGCFLAASSDVELTTHLQSISKTLFGGTGGFVLMKATGPGVVAVSGYGAIQTVTMKSSELIVDHSHVVAWSAGITYEVSTLTAGNGFLKGIFRGLTSGEGLVNRFAGTGCIYLCTRNKKELCTWIQSQRMKSDAADK